MKKTFSPENQIKYTTQFDSHFQDLNNNLKLLESKLADAEINFAAKEDLVNAFSQYKEDFEELTKIQQQIGLDENSGAYGKLRNAAHNFQVITQESNEPELERQLLLLRKYEKDFMLRYDIKYTEHVYSTSLRHIIYIKKQPVRCHQHRFILHAKCIPCIIRTVCFSL